MRTTIRIVSLILSAVCACSLAVAQDTIATLKAKADKGDPAAQTELATLYYREGGSGADPNAAISCWKKAARQDYVPAMLALGRAYINGKIYGNGVDEDFSQAWLWFELAAHHGDQTAQDEVKRAEDELGTERLKRAQIRLADMLMQGDTVNRDSKFAIELYEAAAKGGRVEAQLRLVGIYTSSDGQTRDLAAAQRICALLDNKNNLAAPYCVARVERASPTPDWKRVVTHYEKALDFGPEPAIELGDLYAEGQHVRRDYVNAYLLYSRAFVYPKLPYQVIGVDQPERLEQVIAAKMHAVSDKLGLGDLEALANADRTPNKSALVSFSEHYYTGTIAPNEVDAAASVCSALQKHRLAVAHYCYARVERATPNPMWEKVVTQYTLAVISPSYHGCNPVDLCLYEPRASIELADMYAGGIHVKRDNVRAIVLYALSVYSLRHTRGQQSLQQEALISKKISALDGLLSPSEREEAHKALQDPKQRDKLLRP